MSSRTTAALEAELHRRIIDPSQFVADASAFVDVHLPRSAGKTSFSFIGPGVTQNELAPTNIAEPHGFCVGAAGLEPGMVNNSHLHYTAEVFVCLTGKWRMIVGLDAPQELVIGPGDVFSVPTWVFRAFENVGDAPGLLYTFLGGDDPGGIVWSPKVLRAARETGYVLDEDEKVRRVEELHADEPVLEPLPDEVVAKVERYSTAELESRVVRHAQRRWQDRPLLSGVLAQHRVSVAPVIGYGFTEHRRPISAIAHPHGFSVQWLRIEPGSSLGVHRIDRPAAMLAMDASVGLAFGLDETATRAVAPGSVVSLPARAWRDIVNLRGEPAEIVLAVSGEGRTPVEWSPSIAAAAQNEGWVRDADGCVAPVELVRRRLG
jgi:mannose-6-phosphate isomerase-like protein (cupin superfamily)